MALRLKGFGRCAAALRRPPSSATSFVARGVPASMNMWGPQLQAQRSASLTAVNPGTGEVAWEMPAWTAEQAMQAITKTDAAGSAYGQLPLEKRKALLTETSNLLKERVEELAQAASVEMGKSIKEARGEVLKCTTICDYYAANLEQFLTPDSIDIGAKASYVSFEPIGTVLLIMPWNFPYWQVFRQGAAALAAGNAVVLKHASNVPKCAQLTEDVFREAAERAGIADTGLFLNIPVRGSAMEPVMAHKAIRAISLTGSTEVGSTIGAQAGKLIKPSVLELGGADGYLVLEDADLEKAATACAAGRMLNCGQSCIGAKRFIAVDAIYDEFLELFKQKMAAYKVGPQHLEDTMVGPMVDEKSRQEVHGQVLECIEKGARLVLGGELLPGPGAFYPPTIIAECPPGTPGYEEEIFGPVATVMKANDEEDGIRICNANRYGLGAAVFTKNVEKGEHIARHRLQAGLCFVNDFVKSDARLPFGGVKDSGYGRECAQYGIKAFVNIKTVVVRD